MGITITTTGSDPSGTKSAFISQLGAATRSLNAEIKKTIIQVKAVDTGRMKNNTKVKIEYDFSRDKFTITQKGVKSTDYYIYVDQGTIYMKARNITEKTLNKKKVQLALDKLFDKYMDYMIDRQFN
jgi:HK97 gp10 family phage protein